MKRTVKGGADQRIHAGADADVLDLTLAFHLRYRRQQHTGLRRDVTARFQPQFVA